MAAVTTSTPTAFRPGIPDLSSFAVKMVDIVRGGHVGYLATPGPHLHYMTLNGDWPNFVMNATRRPETILNQQKLSDIHELAAARSGGGSGMPFAPTYQWATEDPTAVMAGDEARMRNTLNAFGLAVVPLGIEYAAPYVPPAEYDSLIGAH
jgi:hypothetical protein